MSDTLHQNLEQYHSNTEIVHATARQISKDFAMFGMEISFSGNTSLAYIELMDQLTGHLHKLLQYDHEKLFALMYQIDISQVSISECLRSHSNPAHSIADLIIRREMMKVLTVRYFKQQKNKL